MAGKLKSRQRKVKMKGVTLCGRREGTLRVLTKYVANPLRVHLPAPIRLSRNWTLLYSIDQHGISLNTIQSLKAQPNPPSGALLVVKDSFDGMFGAWIGEGGCVVVEFSFPWRYRIDMSPPLEMDGHYGLYIDSSVLEGSSAPCPTFDNPVLCAQSPS
ncbi:TLD-domain-containing protein, partial [Pisolithus croceorrhizus]